MEIAASNSMIRRPLFFGIILSLLLSFCGRAQRADSPALKGPYLGQRPPGPTPEVFAPGIISRGYSERSVVFSPGQDELFYELRCLGFTTVLLRMTQTGEGWSKPETAAFSGIPEYSDGSPFFTYDGRRLFFVSQRPLPGADGAKKETDIWLLSKTDGAWGEPRHAGFVLNSAFNDEYPTLSKSNNLYFSSNRSGNSDIYVARFSESGFSEPRRLEAPVNTQDYEGHPFIAADESYLIFSSDRPGQLGDADLYISFKGGDGEWLEPLNLGERVNSPLHEAAPYVSPDGRYLFFCSYRSRPGSNRSARLSYSEILELLDGPGNGGGDIYWVSAKIIQDLRPKGR